MPRWNYDNAERIFTDAGNIARRIETGQATVTGLLKEYRCGYALFRRSVMRALGQERAEALLRGAARVQESAERRRIETEIAELKRGPGVRPAWWCLGCGHEIENTDEACPKCGGRQFEKVNIPDLNQTTNEHE